MQYYVNNCSTCGQNGMVFAVVLENGLMAAQCDECERRYLHVEEVGCPGAGVLGHHDDKIDHAASWDEIESAGWASSFWEISQHDHFEYLKQGERNAEKDEN